MTILHGRVSCATLLMVQTIMLIVLHGEISNAQPSTYICNDGFNYTAGSAFESNLNTVLNSLVQDTYQTGFNTSVYGQSPNRIYGLLQCIGDTTVEQCYSCSQEAITTIRQNCGNAGGSLIWFDFCFLRYENYSFIGQVDITNGLYVYNTQSVSSPDVFNQALGSLFTNLSAEAASGSELYATGIARDSLFRKIYGLVQCNRDMSGDDCKTCLSQTITTVLACYGGRQEARGLIGSCIVSYEIYRTGLPLPSAEAPNTPQTSPAEALAYTLLAPLTQPQFRYANNFRSLFESSLAPEPTNTGPPYTEPPSPEYPPPSPEYPPPSAEYPPPSPEYPPPSSQYPAPPPPTNTVPPYTEPPSSEYPPPSPEYPPPSAEYPPPSAEYPPPSSQYPAPPPPTNTVPPKPITASKRRPIILGVAGGLFLVLLVCLFANWRRLKTAIFPTEYKAHEQADELTLQVEEHTAISVEETSISEDRQIVFKMETLVAATQNFHDDNKLGEGGFGPVYKGTTEDGKEIAVKKLYLNSIQGKKEFMNEVKLVAKIQHRNLVRLLGYCAGGSEMLLVYEYLPNHSLDKILFDPNKRQQLDWQTRYSIILGVARGLLYLHQDSHVRIIHRDIKASNILLDEKMNPKIADFGLAKLFPEDESHVTTRLAGTFGYMAPEYVMQGQLSTKADVYSFGILLLELITGRKNTNNNLSTEMQILLGWAWRSYEGGNTVQMIDTSIIETCDEEQALRCIHVGLLCTQTEASLRPPMSTVTLMLSSPSIMLPDPTKPFFVGSNIPITKYMSYGFGSSQMSTTTTSSSSLTPPSNSYASTTDMVPR